MHTLPVVGTKLEIRILLHQSCYCLGISTGDNTPDFSICAERDAKGDTLPFSGIVKDHPIYHFSFLLVNELQEPGVTVSS